MDSSKALNQQEGSPLWSKRTGPTAGHKEGSFCGSRGKSTATGGKGPAARVNGPGSHEKGVLK